MVRGLVINKFRGDPAILAPGLGQLEAITGVPVLGVVPYLQLQLDDEDSLSERLQRPAGPAAVEIAVIRLPRLSNFTDFNALELLEGVAVQYVDHPARLGKPDLVILPGTKNTMEDLLWLRQSGLEAAILKHAAAGGAVLGICGGYQMLGERLDDPDGVEHGGTLRGMGLLPVQTVFLPEKTRTRAAGCLGQVEGVLAPCSGAAFEGYEIHMGRTLLAPGARPLAGITTLSGQPVQQTDGCQQGNVYGCYLHGLFDRPQVAGGLLQALRSAKGLAPKAQAGPDWQAHKEQQYDLLADALRSSLDMEKIYRILEAGL